MISFVVHVSFVYHASQFQTLNSRAFELRLESKRFYYTIQIQEAKEGDKMLRSPFYEKQRELGANFTEFAGYEMPLYYTSILEEHFSVRRRVGLFDVSHMGNIKVKGKDAEKLLEYASVSNISKLIPGRSVYTSFLREKGTIVDDLIIYRVGEDEFVFVPNAGMHEEEVKWIKKLKEERKFNAKIEDYSNKWAMLALQGPEAASIMENLGIEEAVELKSFGCAELELFGMKILCSRTGYTGEDGFEFQFNLEGGNRIWDGLVEAGKKYKILPCGLGARDLLRLEKCFSLASNEFAGGRTPLEAGLSWTINWEGEFVGKEALLKQKEGGNYERIAYLKCEKRCVPRHGCSVYSGSEIAGKVSSGGLSPCIEKGIALAYLKPEYRESSDLSIDIRGKKFSAELTKPPFVKRGEC